MVRDRLRDVWMSNDQYFRPSAHLSYAVELRKESDNPTTKPKTVRRMLSTETVPFPLVGEPAMIDLLQTLTIIDKVTD